MIRVAIIEDNEAYRKALEALISMTNDLEVVYAASDCNGIDNTFTVIMPDVAIMDIEMPGLTGIEGVKLIRRISPGTNVFMLTVFEDDANIFESIKAGAMGYLLKKDSPNSIIEAIRNVHKGEAIMNGKIARKVLEYFSKKNSAKDVWQEYNLTNRETEILQLLMKGLSYKEIAAKCFISIDTMFSHIRKIYNKLNVHSRSEIAAKFR
ncbi:MAG: DNA-binding response regulator [Segetibacter sp.]|nr:DNA-binding response regulator [Segetibacter sp.]